MATAKEKYLQLKEALQKSKENRELADKLVKYSKPMTSELNHRDPVLYGEGQEPQENNEPFIPYIFENAQEKRWDDKESAHKRARNKLRNI